MRLFLDANVLFSAARDRGSRSFLLFELARSGACELVSSGYAIEEARRNLAGKHPERSAEFESLVAEVSVCAEAASGDTLPGLAERLPEKDVPIMLAAIRAGADGLVTGDRTHFGDLFGRRVAGVEVLSLAQALARLTQG